MLKELELEYLNKIENDYIRSNSDELWYRTKKKTKKKYFRKFTARVWKRYSRYILLRPYLINKNLWYSGKKGILNSKLSSKILPIVNWQLNHVVKLQSIVNDFIEKF